MKKNKPTFSNYHSIYLSSTNPAFLRSYQIARDEGVCNKRLANAEDLLIGLLSQTDFKAVRALHELGLDPDLVRSKGRNKYDVVATNQKKTLFGDPIGFVLQFFKPSPFDSEDIQSVIHTAMDCCGGQHTHAANITDYLKAYTTAENSPLLPLLKHINVSVEDIQQILTNTGASL